MSENIKLVCFDLNKTLIKENTWYQLNLAMGVTSEEDQRLYDLWEKGDINYPEWQKLLSEIYRKNGRGTKEKILEVISNYTYLDGAREIVEYLNNTNYKIALISGSIDLLVEKVARELSIEYYAAHNKFVFDENNMFKEIVCEGEDSEFKLKALKKICSDLRIDLKEAVVVGDGENDLPIFKATGRGVTFKGSKIENKSWKVIEKLQDIKNML